MGFTGPVEPEPSSVTVWPTTGLAGLTTSEGVGGGSPCTVSTRVVMLVRPSESVTFRWTL